MKTSTLAALTMASAVASIFHVHPLPALPALFVTFALLLAYWRAAERDVDKKLTER